MIEKHVGSILGFVTTLFTLAVTGILYVARSVPRLDGRIDTLEATVKGQQNQNDDLKEWLTRVEAKLDASLVRK